MNRFRENTAHLREKILWIFLPEKGADRHRLRVWVFRILALASLVLGVYYLYWRYTDSLNFDALWFAVALVMAETFSLVDSTLFSFMMWKPPRRTAPPPLEGVSVDVFIATYNEPVELVRLTAEAAKRIRWPDLEVYVLDDGARPEMEKAASELEVGYIKRGESWEGKARHAKAGNINNALLETSGNYILILDADQIPSASIVERTVGYFTDPRLAFVQTPQFFYNVQTSDPFGSDAPLFYGPIQQGKDGWNAAFFCGSNALLNRDALLQLGLSGYVDEMEKRMRTSVVQLEREARVHSGESPIHSPIMEQLRSNLLEANRDLKAGVPLEEVSSRVRNAIAKAQSTVIQDDFDSIASDLVELGAAGNSGAIEAADYLSEQREQVEAQIQQNAPPATETFGLSSQAVEAVDLTRADEAIPVHSLATYSVTEDMATAMKLHSMGWKSVFHPEILAYGLAPEDLGGALNQRLRWAQGTLQVFQQQNPFLMKGLSFPQKLQYFTTMFSYFSGFFNLIFLAAPIIYLLTGIPPVSAWSSEFLWRLIPFLLINRIVFRYVSWGLSTWRGEQYSLALFPVWIKAVVSVLFGARLKFIVTPKRQVQDNNAVRLVWPQLLVVWLTSVAIVYGITSLILGWNPQVEGVLVNVVWGGYNIYMLSAIIRAALYKPSDQLEAIPPPLLYRETPIQSG